jgi:hypothetical protein
MAWLKSCRSRRWLGTSRMLLQTDSRLIDGSTKYVFNHGFQYSYMSKLETWASVGESVADTGLLNESWKIRTRSMIDQVLLCVTVSKQFHSVYMFRQKFESSPDRLQRSGFGPVQKPVTPPMRPFRFPTYRTSITKISSTTFCCQKGSFASYYYTTLYS